MIRCGRAAASAIVVAVTWLTATPVAAEEATDQASLAHSADGVIYLVREDGSGRSRLVAGSDPAWSPDGARLAFVKTSRGGGRADIYLLDMTTGTKTRVTAATGVERSPAFSPDGAEIAYIAEGRDSRTANGSVHVVSTDGTGDRALTAPRSTSTRLVADDAPTWRPDGARVVFSRSTFDFRARSESEFLQFEIRTVAADGTGETVLIADGYQPAFSPDGSRIAFASTRDDFGSTCFGHDECYSSAEIYVAAADGSGALRLTRDKANDEEPAWSLDGTRVAFVSNRDAVIDFTGGEILEVSSRGSCTRMITNGISSKSAPAFRPQTNPPAPPAAPPCGEAVPPDLGEIQLGGAATFKRFPLYWLGRVFDGLMLTDVVVGRDVLFEYADCSRLSPRCGGEVQLQIRSVCSRHPLSFGSKRGTFYGFPEFVDFGHQHVVAARGAFAVSYPSAGGWDAYIGGTTVTVFGPELPRQIRPVLARLRRLAEERASGRLPAPRLPRRVIDHLTRIQTLSRRLHTARAVARRLKILPGEAKARLRMARVLDRIAQARGKPIAPTRCERRKS